MFYRLAIGAAAAFVLALGAFGLLARGGGGTPATAAPAPELPLPSAGTDQRIASLQDIVRARPREARGYVLLAGAYAQKLRETGDAQLYGKAERLLATALELDPSDPEALTQRGSLALSRHDFRAALRDARAARRAAPDLDRPFGVLVDALIELGRYDQAGAALQEMVDRKPDVASYARVSYWRELHGDLAGARRAMVLAIGAGSGSPEGAAYLGAQLSHLDLVRGRTAQAERAARAALHGFPGHPAAEAALARAQAARGRLPAAITRLRRLVARLPLPEHVIALGELEIAAGRPAAGRRDLALIGAQRRLLASSGVDMDAELAVFEADHGSPRRGVAHGRREWAAAASARSARRAVLLGRRAWASAPSVRSADALGWALTRAGRAEEGLRWARRALMLGSRDPSFLAHAGLAARATGDRAAARRLLTAARRSPALPPLLRREVER